MCQSKCLNYCNVFRKRLTSESMHTGACIIFYVTLKGDVKSYLCLSKMICGVHGFLKQSTLALNVKYQVAISTQRWKIMKQAVDGQQKKCVAYCEPCFKEKTLEQKQWWEIEQHKKLDGQDLGKEQEKYVLQLLL